MGADKAQKSEFTYISCTFGMMPAAFGPILPATSRITVMLVYAARVTHLRVRAHGSVLPERQCQLQQCLWSARKPSAVWIDVHDHQRYLFIGVFVG